MKDIKFYTNFLLQPKDVSYISFFHGLGVLEVKVAGSSLMEFWEFPGLNSLEAVKERRITSWDGLSTSVSEQQLPKCGGSLLQGQRCLHLVI